MVKCLIAMVLLPGCTCSEQKGPALPEITAPFRESFDRAELGPDWLATDPAAYRIEHGELVARRAHNRPLWLRRPIPPNAVIELDCWSNDEAGDVKVEAWGDGKSFASEASYTSTSYNFIFGGWQNQLSTLARLDEHGADRKTRTEPRVEKGRRYHFTIERTGAHLAWRIDGQPFLAFDDPQPLAGEAHRYFALNDWEAELHFDNLVITPR